VRRPNAEFNRTKTLAIVGIALNSIALALFAASYVYVRVFAPIATSRNITAMDRAGVFCEDKLREFDPQLAANIRHNVGPFIAKDYRHAVALVLSVAVATSAVTLVLLVLVGRVSGRSQRMTGSDDGPGSVAPPADAG
jgi:hypothetical protein